MFKRGAVLLGICLVLLTGCGSDKGLTISGTIEAKEIVVSAEVGGVVKELPVAEGSQVKAGDLIAKLDPVILQYQADQARAGLAAAEARAREIGAGTRTEQLKATKANVEQVKALASGAQGLIDTLQSSIQENSSKIGELKNAVNYANDPTARQQVVTLEGVQTNLNIQLASAKSQLKGYQTQVTSAQAQYDLVAAGATSQAKEAANAQVDQAKAGLKLAEAQLAKCEIKAPADGVISTLGLKTGELAAPGIPVTKLSLLKNLSLTVYVPENQLSKVEVGQAVSFTVDAYPKEKFNGKIQKINSQAEFTPKNVQTPSERINMVFGVTIEVTSGQEKLKPGMPADVTL
jgi:HlyD family secretion protein